MEILETFMPRAHTRLEGFAECALDEGRFFNTVPRTPAEERQMMKREVLERFDELSIEAQVEIDEEIELELERLRYELEITRRLMDKAADPRARDDWRIQADVLEMLIGQEDGRLAERQADIARYEVMIAEIEAGLLQEEEE